MNRVLVHRISSAMPEGNGIRCKTTSKDSKEYCFSSKDERDLELAGKLLDSHMVH